MNMFEEDPLYDIPPEQYLLELKSALTKEEFEKLITVFDVELFLFRNSHQSFFLDKERSLIKDFPLESLAPALFSRNFDGIHILFLRLPNGENKIQEFKDVLNSSEYNKFLEKGILPDCNVERMLEHFNIHCPFEFFGKLNVERAQIEATNIKSGKGKIGIYLLKFSFPGGKAEYYEIRAYSSEMNEARERLLKILSENNITERGTTETMKLLYESVGKNNA